MVHLRKRRSLFAKLSSHKKEEYKKEKNNANEEDIKPKFVSFTCGEPGHFFPNCPKQETKNPPSKSNECLNCGEEGHWANKFPHKNLFAGPFKKKDIFAKNCPLLRWLLWRPRRKKGQRTKRSACYTCRNTGHWTKDCPKLGKVMQILKRTDLRKK